MLSVRGICYLADRKRVGCRPGRDTPVSKLLSSGEMSLRFPYYHWWQICFHQLVSYGKNMEKLYTYHPISHYLGQDITIHIWVYSFSVPKRTLPQCPILGLKNQTAASSPRRGATGAMTRMLPNPWHKEAIRGTSGRQRDQRA